MPAIHRLHLHVPRLPVPRLPVVMLACAVLLVGGAAVASLVSLHDPALAAIVAVAGFTGIAGAAAAYVAAADQETVMVSPPTPPTPEQRPAPQSLQARQAVAQATLPRPPLRIQSLPVADLPPAYLAAVRKGAAANRAALKARPDRV